MGRVLLSITPEGELVALKQIHSQLVEDEGFRARFRREVAISRKVAGNYLSAIVDADADAPVPWLVSKYVPGPSLQEVVGSIGALPEASVRRLAEGLALAVGEIHMAGMVHRDLKPSNVLLADDGPVVIDFGIARAADSQTSSQLTHSGALIGSPGFMSPEQAQGQPVGPASDIFSLGTVLAMASTGECLFTGTSVPQTLFNIVFKEPDLSSLPEGIRNIVAVCVAKDPDSRPTAAQLLQIIGELAPTDTPWPPEVNTLIAAQRAEVERLQSELGDRSEGPERDTGPKSAEASDQFAKRPVHPEQKHRRRLMVVAGAAAVTVLSVSTAILVGRSNGTGSTPTPTPTPTPYAQPQYQTSPRPSPSFSTQPPPAVTTTQPRTQPAAIVSCEQQALTRPTTLLLACGDGKRSLQNLTWTDWGLPTATAHGQVEETTCEPSCLSGTTVRYSATVTVSGLAAGRYSRMQVSAPRSPTGSVTNYSLRADGPLLR